MIGCLFGVGVLEQIFCSWDVGFLQDLSCIYPMLIATAFSAYYYSHVVVNTECDPDSTSWNDGIFVSHKALDRNVFISVYQWQETRG